MFCPYFTALMLAYFRAASISHKSIYLYPQRATHTFSVQGSTSVFTQHQVLVSFGDRWWWYLQWEQEKGCAHGEQRGAAPEQPLLLLQAQTSGALEKRREQEFEGAAFHLRATSGMAATMLRSWEDATSSCAAQQKVPAQIPSCKVQKCISSRHGDVYNSLVTLQSSAASLGQPWLGCSIALPALCWRVLLALLCCCFSPPATPSWFVWTNSGWGWFLTAVCSQLCYLAISPRLCCYFFFFSWFCHSAPGTWANITQSVWEVLEMAICCAM